MIELLSTRSQLSIPFVLLRSIRQPASQDQHRTGRATGGGNKSARRSTRATEAIRQPVHCPSAIRQRVRRAVCTIPRSASPETLPFEEFARLLASYASWY